jgi:hypothetical protein
VLGLKRLQDDLARRLGAPSTTGHLSKKLKRSFGRAKVWKREALVG